MAYTDTDVPLPDIDRDIEFRRKGQSNWQRGRVSLVWLALDEAAIDVIGTTNCTIIPAFGDEWRYI